MNVQTGKCQVLEQRGRAQHLGNGVGGFVLFAFVELTDPRIATFHFASSIMILDLIGPIIDASQAERA